jgi:hypothetical protein
VAVLPSPYTAFVAGGYIAPTGVPVLVGRAGRQRIIPLSDLPRCRHRARGILLAEFVFRQSGAPWRDVAALECPDVHLFAQLFMSLNYLARTDRELFGLDDRTDHAALPFTHGSLWLA